MNQPDSQSLWRQYCEKELAVALPVFEAHDICVDDEQPQLMGERYLISATKLVLMGRRKTDGVRVVVKWSRNTEGRYEIEREYQARDALKHIRFAYHVFDSPPELLYQKTHTFTLFVTLFIEQDVPFLERPRKEQFFLALQAFEAQEAIHATTYGHARSIRPAFEMIHAHDYLARLAGYVRDVTASSALSSAHMQRYLAAQNEVRGQVSLIERYGDFLTHGDFVPHNMRVQGRRMYLLDHFAIHFGNKYEGWARFLNFMSLHHPWLEDALTTYVRDNRAAEESEVLHVMRIYRLMELVRYYVDRRNHAVAEARLLSEKRISFWMEVLAAQMERRPLATSIREAYIVERDTLRTAEEKRRQIGLH